MKAIVLAAGKGERLWPLTTCTPKPLLPVLCKPLILWQLEALVSRLDINDIYVVMGRGEKDITDALNSAGFRGFKTVVQTEPRGTGEAVRLALDAIEAKDNERILIMYSDIFVDPDIIDVILNRVESSSPSILGVKVSDISSFGELIVDSRGKLVDIREKTGDCRPGIINGGIMVLPAEELRHSLRELRPSARGELELTDSLAYLSKSQDIEVVTLSEDKWTDVGKPWTYLEANRRALRSLCDDREECIIGEDKIEQRGPVSIEGRLFIGGQVELGPFAGLRGDNVLCGKNKIGFASQVKSSVLLRGAKAPHLNYIGDSVLGRDVNMGAGAVTANLRHDDKPVMSMLKGQPVSTGLRKLGAIIGDEAKIGVNVSILPGVKIGCKAWIDSGCVIYRDIPDYALVKCRGTLDIIIRETEQDVSDSHQV